MRRYLVKHNYKNYESYNDYETAVKTARRLRACYEGNIIIIDNLTNKITVF